MSNLIIPYKLINEMDDLTLFLYTSTQLYTRYTVEYLKMPIEKFYLDAFQTRRPTKLQKEKLHYTLIKLEDRGYIKFQGNILEIYPPQFKLSDGDHFITIDSVKFQAILDSNHRYDVKWSLLHYYCWLITSLDFNIEIDGRKSVVGHMSQGFFIDKTGLCQQTISRHHKYLEDLRLIYTSRCQKCNNYYGRYEDKKLIDKFRYNT